MSVGVSKTQALRDLFLQTRQQMAQDWKARERRRKVEARELDRRVLEEGSRRLLEAIGRILPELQETLSPTRAEVRRIPRTPRTADPAVEFPLPLPDQPAALQFFDYQSRLFLVLYCPVCSYSVRIPVRSIKRGGLTHALDPCRCSPDQDCGRLARRGGCN